MLRIQLLTIVLKIHKSLCIPLLVEKSLSIIIIIEFAFHKKIQNHSKTNLLHAWTFKCQKFESTQQDVIFLLCFFALLTYVNIDFCFELPNGNIGGILLFLEITMAPVCNYYLKKSMKSSNFDNCSSKSMVNDDLDPNILHI